MHIDPSAPPAEKPAGPPVWRPTIEGLLLRACVLLFLGSVFFGAAEAVREYVTLNYTENASQQFTNPSNENQLAVSLARNINSVTAWSAAVLTLIVGIVTFKKPVTWALRPK